MTCPPPPAAQPTVTPTAMPTVSTKEERRRELLARVTLLDPQDRHEAAAEAARRVVRLREWRSAQTVLLFLAMSDELDTTPLAMAAWQAGKTVCVPRIAGRRMELVTLASLSDRLTPAPGLPRVMQPTTGRTVQAATLDFALVPGVGFTRAGDRLGRGGGYYDRLLARPDLIAATCGYTYDVQLVADLPTEPHDRSVQIVATPDGVTRS